MGKAKRAVATVLFAAAVGSSICCSWVAMEVSAEERVQRLVADDLKQREVAQVREIENLRAEIQRWKHMHGKLGECHRHAVDQMIDLNSAGWTVVPPELTGSNLDVDYQCSMLERSEAEPGDEALN